ncbi:MAG: ATP-binding cassette domain-containing protein [Candidatus Bathyarchaeia archaeon]
MEYVIETNDLTKVYGSGKEAVTAVDHENLRVKKGSIFGILGPNGAGKTTFVMMLNGLILPTSGTAKVLGYDIVRESLQIRKNVGLLPEGFGFYDHLTAKQNLNYIAALNDIPKEERDERVDEILKAVGLDEFKDRKVGGFSRGMKQRLAIAQTLIKDPELLIFDEPTAGVDPEGAKAFKDLVSKLNKEQGKTIVICTHLLFEVGPLCTDVAIMNRGKFVIQGNVEEIVERMMAEEGYRIEVEARGDIGALAEELKRLSEITGVEVKGRNISINATSDVRAEINRRAAKIKGLEVLSIRRLEPSLEDLFMKYYQREIGVVARG